MRFISATYKATEAAVAAVKPRPKKATRVFRVRVRPSTTSDSVASSKSTPVADRLADLQSEPDIQSSGYIPPSPVWRRTENSLRPLMQPLSRRHRLPFIFSAIRVQNQTRQKLNTEFTDPQELSEQELASIMARKRARENSVQSVDIKRCAFIGGGMMATAMVKGFVESGFLSPDKIVISSPMHSPDLKNIDGISCINDNASAVRDADVVILAVKPHILGPAIDSIRQEIRQDKLFISIAAGASTESIEEKLRTPDVPEPRVVRVMPNTPCAVGETAAAISKGSFASDSDSGIAQAAMGPLGTIVDVPENLMDAVTGVAGSGPAYVYIMIEAMADGAVRAGLPRDIALRLAAQTVRGAASMVLNKEADYGSRSEAQDEEEKPLQHPAVLKDQVCSPGGTTIAGVRALEANGFRSTIMEAVMASANRGRALKDGVEPLTGVDSNGR